MFQATGAVRGHPAGIRQGNATGEAARPMKAAQFVARRGGRNVRSVGGEKPARLLPGHVKRLATRPLEGTLRSRVPNRNRSAG
jgi:hypothetical protein